MNEWYYLPVMWVHPEDLLGLPISSAHNILEALHLRLYPRAQGSLPSFTNSVFHAERSA